MKKRYSDWVEEYPGFVIIRKEGFFYTARGEYAEILHELLGYKIGYFGNIKVTGSPKIETIEEVLIANQIDFIVIVKNEIRTKKEFKGQEELKNKIEEENGYFSEENIVENTTDDVDNNISADKEVLNEKEDLIDFIDVLLKGIDPLTGEKYDEDNVICSPNMQEILSIAKHYIKYRIRREKYKPELEGKRWTREEDEQLKGEYMSQVPISNIAKIHGRSTGAIKSRIIKIFPEITN